jgi:tetratricopeptide (TPR) repeat protein
VISAIGGTAGVGKTALALHWAHQVADRFPDGQLYVNLRGFGPSGTPATPGEAIRGFLDALGAPADRIPPTLDSQAALYRSLLAGKRVLIILDNARDADQVRPLLPGSPGILVVVTSRRQLSGLVAAEGAHAITLDMLTQADAADLLARRIGTNRTAAEPGPAAELIELCARLPLALAVTAARAVAHPNFPLTALAAELRDEQGRLAALDAGDAATSVRAAFSWSCRHLTPAAARMFRLLGLHPGPDVSLPAAASLAGLPQHEARAALAELTTAYLLTEHAPDRFTSHDLLRAHAAEQARAIDSERERRAARHRMIGHYLHSARAADRRLYPARRPPIDVEPTAAGTTPERFADCAQALAWFDTERQVLLAAIGLAAAEGFDTCTWQLTWTMETFLNRRDHLHDWAATQRAALAAAHRLGDSNAKAHAHRGIANALLELGDCHGAHTHLQHATMLRRRLRDRTGQARLLLDLCRLHRRQGQTRQALRSAQQALGVYRELGERWGEANALNEAGWTLGQLGDYRQALACCQQALVIMIAFGDRHNAAAILDSLGYAHRHLGHHARAAACYRHAVRLNVELGETYYQARTLASAGNAYRAAGELPAAHDAWQEALGILAWLHSPHADQLRAELEALATGAPPAPASSPRPPAAARR